MTDMDKEEFFESLEIATQRAKRAEKDSYREILESLKKYSATAIPDDVKALSWQTVPETYVVSIDQWKKISELMEALGALLVAVTTEGVSSQGKEVSVSLRVLVALLPSLLDDLGFDQYQLEGAAVSRLLEMVKDLQSDDPDL